MGSDSDGSFILCLVSGVCHRRFGDSICEETVEETKTKRKIVHGCLWIMSVP